MRCALGVEMVETRGELAVSEARAATRKQVGSVCAEAAEQAERPVTLARRIDRPVVRVAVAPHTTGDSHHGDTNGLLALRL